MEDTLNSEERIIKDEELTRLLMAGSEKWNDWVLNNRNASIQFSDFHLVHILKNPHQDIEEQGDLYNFRPYIFPNGTLDFSNVRFNKPVYFEGCNFGSGNVTFEGSRFDGQVTDFSKIKYWGISFDFSRAVFSGRVTFSDAKFMNHHCFVSFMSASFNGKSLDFSHAKFEIKTLKFNAVTLDNCHANFYNSHLALRTNDFSRINICGGDMLFSNTQIYGDIEFDYSDFGEGNFSLLYTSFGCSKVSFQSCTFDGHFCFSHSFVTDTITELSFKKSIFGASVDLSGNYLSCIPDLTLTSFSNQFSFQELICKPKFHKKNWLTDKITDHFDVERLCRLKELAEDNKDHERALNFHADELRAKRTLDETGKLSACLDHLYQMLSDYGRSVLRPSIGLVASWLGFSVIYFLMSDVIYLPDELWDKFTTAMSYSGGYTFPLLPDGKLSRLEGIEVLFEGKSTFFLHFVNFIQGITSTVFVFLAGLGLRNRFRL